MTKMADAERIARLELAVTGLTAALQQMSGAACTRPFPVLVEIADDVEARAK